MLNEPFTATARSCAARNIARGQRYTGKATPANYQYGKYRISQTNQRASHPRRVVRLIIESAFCLIINSERNDDNANYASAEE